MRGQNKIIYCILLVNSLFGLVMCLKKKWRTKQIIHSLLITIFCSLLFNVSQLEIFFSNYFVANVNFFTYNREALDIRPTCLLLRNACTAYSNTTKCLQFFRKHPRVPGITYGSTGLIKRTYLSINRQCVYLVFGTILVRDIFNTTDRGCDTAVCHCWRLGFNDSAITLVVR